MFEKSKTQRALRKHGRPMHQLRAYIRHEHTLIKFASGETFIMKVLQFIKNNMYYGYIGVI